VPGFFLSQARAAGGPQTAAPRSSIGSPVASFASRRPSKTETKPTTIYVDLGYRWLDQQNPGIQINHRGKSKRLREDELKLLKRWQSIEPTIGHLK
jgi:hypothetical protein